MKALILVDLQNDFCPGGALAVPEGDQTIAVANTLMPKFERVIATQDWHPADHSSFASNNPGTEIGQVIEQDGIQQIMWPDHCIQGTAGAEFHADLNRFGITAVVRKGTDRAIDSYSGFFDNGRQKATELNDVLKANDAGEVYVCGLATDYCVKFTALDAADLGYKTYLVRDGCRPVNLSPDDEQNAIDEMKDAGVTVVQSADLQSRQECRPQ